MYKRILLAYDGSQAGRQALLECGDVAHLMQAEIRLLAVIPLLAPAYAGEGFVPSQPIEVDRKEYENILQEGIAQLQQRGFQSAGEVRFGEPAEEIVTAAEEWQADLIVIGHTRAKSWAERWWRGSISKSLIEIAPCSVLVAIIATA